MDMKLGYCAQVRLLSEAMCFDSTNVALSRWTMDQCSSNPQKFCLTYTPENFDIQGDRTQKVGVVDSEYIVHQSIQTLGGQSAKKVIY